MHRFFIPPGSIRGEHVDFPRPAAEQMRSVLRIASGERVVVLVDDGWECEVEVTRIGKGEAEGRLLDRRPNSREPRVALTLYQCLLKADHFEWVLQKGVEVGVTRFVPVVSERTVVRGETAGRKRERWERIVVEAAEQSGRGHIPVLGEVMSASDAWADCAAHDFKAVAWEEEHAVTLGSLRDDAGGRAPASIGLVIGPEGGFSPAEIEAAGRCGVPAVTLGVRTLRAETAAVVMAALALDMFGELG